MNVYFERYQRLLLKTLYCFAIKSNSALTATAEEKYIKLTNGYPDIIARVPQHMIASLV
jgi:hypothetical protein